jgi:hypothetical protein
MKIILSSDVELWSWNKNFKQDVEIGTIRLVELVYREKIPITFFISLSDKGYGSEGYLENIKAIISKLRSKKIEFGVHTHCSNLPLEFETPSDKLKDYNEKEIIDILKWNKRVLEDITKKKIVVHRAGGYNIPSLEILNDCFKKTGLKIDSSDITQEYSSISKRDSLVEIPPATNKKYSKKLIVFGPEQMSLKQMFKFYYKAKKRGAEVIVINFHSFSVYGNLGFKAKIWHKMPVFIRKRLKKLLENKKKEIKEGIFIENESRQSPNFEKLIKLISFLKNKNCEFINFEEYINFKD